MRPSQNHCTCTIPCMVTQAFYTSTTLCILSWSHNVLQCQYFWHFGQSHPQYFTFIRPSPVHNQWQSLYYHCGLGPNVAKTAIATGVLCIPKSDKQHQSRKPSRQTCTSFFLMKICASVTKKSFHQNCGLWYLHLSISFYTYTLLFSCRIKSCCDHCFPWEIRPLTTVPLYILQDYSGVRIGFNVISKTTPTTYSIHHDGLNTSSFNHYYFTESWMNCVVIMFLL